MLASIFQQHLLALQGNLLNFAYMLTSNRDDAYDLLQDTTLKALDNKDKYKENTNFKGWVFTIMRNIFINNYRRTNRVTIMTDNTADLYHINSQQSETQPSPENSYIEEEIHKAIDSFSDAYRIPFSMHISGYRYSEIADRMNLPVGTIKSRIYYARQRLRSRLSEYRYE